MRPPHGRATRARPVELDSLRGSRRHVLEWIGAPNFESDLGAMVSEAGAVLTKEDDWRPIGLTDAREARVDAFAREYLGTELEDWSRLKLWWLGKQSISNTPNWDLVSTCKVESKTGLILVEAKANAGELKKKDRKSADETKPASIAQQESIEAAIRDADLALRRVWPNINISTRSHYQLANRLAFSWWLASNGIPVVLVYLGFLNDVGMKRPLLSHADWKKRFEAYAGGVFPPDATGVRLDIGGTPFWLLLRSRRVLSQSPLAPTSGF